MKGQTLSVARLAGLFCKKTIVLYISFYLTFSPLFSARVFAQIAPADNNTTLGINSGAANVPVLNIAKPTDGGVSHNKFLDFNVDNRGLIVNNLPLKDYSTQYQSAISGAHVEFNYNLGTGNQAKVIMNEVVGNSTTALRGYTEIYGHKADYIVANPNGITCAGCGFINTGRLSLITGSANGIDSFNIGNGALSIEQRDGIGLYSQSSADLVSNAVRIAGLVQVDGDLSVYSGNKKFDYAGKTVTSDNSASVPLIAVDSSSLGGMRANSIRIIATQKGFGVNLSGDLVADTANIEITADGNIAFRNAYAPDRITVASRSGDVALNGGTVGAGRMQFDAGRDFLNKSDAVSNGALLVSAVRDFSSTSGSLLSEKDISLAAGGDFTNVVEISAGGNLNASLSNGDFSNSGNIGAEQNINISAAGSFTNTVSGEIVANKRLDIAAGVDFTNDGKASSGTNMSVKAQNDFTNNSEVVANGDMDFSSGRDFTNDGTVIGNGGVLISSLRNFNNSKEISVQKDMAIDVGGSFTNALGKELLSGRDLTIKNATSVTNLGDIKADNNISIQATGNIINGDGNNSANIISGRDMTLDTEGNFLQHAKAYIFAGRDLNLIARGEIRNRSHIDIMGDGFFKAADVHNYGRFLANGKMEFYVNSDLINYESAGILAGGNIAFHIARNLINARNADIYAGGNLLFEGNELSISGSKLVVDDNYRGKYANPYSGITLPESLELPLVPPDLPAEEGIEEMADTTFILDDGTKLVLPADELPEGTPLGTRFETSIGYVFIQGGERIEKTEEIDNPNYDPDCIDTNCEPEKISIPVTKEVDNPDFDQNCTDSDTCAPERINVPVHEYIGEGITIEDADGNILRFTIENPDDSPSGSGEGHDVDEDMDDDVVPNRGTSPVTDSPTLSKDANLAGYDFVDSQMLNLVNFAGRIQAGGDISIGAKYLSNVALNTANGEKYRIGWKQTIRVLYGKNKLHPCLWKCTWREIGHEYVIPGSITLGGEQAIIKAGNNILISSDSLLNQSSVIAAGNDVALKAKDIVQNLTYNETVELKQQMKRRDVYRKGMRWIQKTFSEWRTFQEQVYSKNRSTITAGNAVKINANRLQNDQELSPRQGLGIRPASPTSDLGAMRSVNLALPVGNNGMFRVAESGQYLVVSNVPFLNPNDYVGGSYLLSLLYGTSGSGAVKGDGSIFEVEKSLNKIFGNASVNTDTVKFLGDPAYETRLIMDAITQATQHNYLVNDGSIGSAAEQMTALYNNAAVEADKLGLSMGQALTQTQINALQRDIIWYVQKDVGGQMVMVPELYLAQATLASISGNKGSAITGFSVGIEADYVSNYGEISAEKLLKIDAKEVLNESNDSNVAKITSNSGAVVMKADKVGNFSAEIKGDTVKIEADKIINATNVYAEDYARNSGKKKETFHTEQAGHTASISGTNVVDIDAGVFYNAGADLKSKNGDIDVTAAVAVFDVIKLYNSTSVESTEKGMISKTTTTTTDESLRNIGTTIDAGGTFKLKAQDGVFVNTSITADKYDYDIGREYLLSAVDYDRHTVEKVTTGINFGAILTEIAVAAVAAAVVTVAVVATLATGGLAAPAIIAAGVGGTAGAVDSFSSRDGYIKSKTVTDVSPHETLQGTTINTNKLTAKVDERIIGSGTKINANEKNEQIGNEVVIQEKIDNQPTRTVAKTGRTAGDAAVRGAVIGAVTGVAVGGAVAALEAGWPVNLMINGNKIAVFSATGKGTALTVLGVGAYCLSSDGCSGDKLNDDGYDPSVYNYGMGDDRSGQVPLPNVPQGNLSRESEVGSRGGAGTISGNPKSDGSYACPPNDPGGCSYGSWQIASSDQYGGLGTMPYFLNYLKANDSEAYNILNQAGGAEGAKEGSKDFVSAWQSLANSNLEKFESLQKGFIDTTHYQPQVAYINANYLQLGYDNRPLVVKDVIWSISVQHTRASTIIENALEGRDDLANITDRDLINALYEARIVYVSKLTSISSKDKTTLINRYRDECERALGLLGN